MQTLAPSNPPTYPNEASGSPPGAVSIPSDGIDSVDSASVAVGFGDSVNGLGYLSALALGRPNAPPIAQPPALSGADGNGFHYGIGTGIQRIKSLLFNTNIATTLGSTIAQPGDLVAVSNSSTGQVYGVWQLMPGQNLATNAWTVVNQSPLTAQWVLVAAGNGMLVTSGGSSSQASLIPQLGSGGLINANMIPVIGPGQLPQTSAVPPTAIEVTTPIIPTVASGSNYSVSADIAIWRDVCGMVHIKGLVDLGSGGIPIMDLFGGTGGSGDLPTGYKPLASRAFLVCATGNTGTGESTDGTPAGAATIFSNGKINIQGSGSNQYYSLNGISFLGEQ